MSNFVEINTSLFVQPQNISRIYLAFGLDDYEVIIEYVSGNHTTVRTFTTEKDKAQFFLREIIGKFK